MTINAVPQGVFKSLEEDLNGIEVCQIELPVTEANVSLINNDYDVVISWGGTTIWRGIMKGGILTRQVITALAYNKSYAIASRRTHTATYTGSTTASAILSAICSDDGLTSVWEAGTNPSPQIKFEKTLWIEAIIYLAQVTNNDFWTSLTTPTEVHIGARGSSKGVKTVLDTSQRTIDRSQKTDKVFVRGVVGGAITYGESGAGSNVTVYNDRISNSTAELTTKATSILDEVNKDILVTKIEIPITQGYNVYPGDTITLTAIQLGYSSTVCKVYKSTKTQSSVSVEVEAVSQDMSKAIKALQNLEELGIYNIGAGQLPKGLQAWNSNITFTSSDWDTATWGAGTITFADGTTQSIDAGTTGNLGSAGTRYVYWTWGSTTLGVTSTYSAAVGTDKGVVAKLTVSSDTTQKIGIETFGAKGTTINKDMIDSTIIWDTDELAIETRPWTGDLNIIWDDKDDDPPTDWNHIKWGLKGSEGATDATIKYADGVSVGVNYGQNVDVADGFWFVYWDVNQKTGGKYNLQWTTNYSTASGVGKGVVAAVQVENTKSPSILMYNTYTPTMGVGSLVAHSIFSKHLSADWITGKNFRTAISVGEGGGPAGLRFDAGGIIGYSGGTTKTFQLISSSGIISVYGTGNFTVLKADGTLVGTLNGTNIGGRDKIRILGAATSSDIVIEANAYGFEVRPDGDIDVYSGSVLDTNAARLVLPNTTSDTGRDRTGEVWFRTDL